MADPQQQQQNPPQPPDGYYPRLNGSMIKSHVGQIVSVVGTLDRNNGLLRCCDGTSLSIGMEHVSNPEVMDESSFSTDTAVEVIGQVQNAELLVVRCCCCCSV